MTNPPDDLESKIIMQGIHVELTDAMKDAVYEKFSGLLRHNERIVRINVRLHQDQQMGKNFHYTGTAQVEIGGPDLVATVKGEDAYNILDELVDKLGEQLRDRHERRKEKRNHPQEIELAADLPKVPGE
jgi:putative sigma-54 modulation protein